MAGAEDAVDKTELEGLFGGHEVVALRGGGHAGEAVAGVLGQDAVQILLQMILLLSRLLQRL